MIFFPEYIPAYEGWDESYLPNRLVYLTKPRRGGTGDNSRIRQGLMLMFEDLQNNPTTLDLSDTEVIPPALPWPWVYIILGSLKLM